MRRSTAILLVGFSRPDLIKKRITELCDFVDCPIIVSIDGKHESQVNQPEWREIQQNFPQLEWRFQEINYGIARHIFHAISCTLRDYENCFIIEDDVSIESANLISALRCMEDRFPTNIMTIGLFGGLPSFWPLNKILRNRFRKTRYFSAWGWGVQREDWEGFNLEIIKNFGPRLPESVKELLGPRKSLIWTRRLIQVQENPYRTWDFQLFFYSLMREKSHFLPRFRSCDNEGFNDPRATNTVEPKPSWYRGNTAIGIEPKYRDRLGDSLDKFFEHVDSVTWVSDNLTLQRLRVFRKRVKSQR